ncbi:MAG: hypothetical protein L6Q54_08885 [Leptospiraceae bacterium]|nr:glucosidase [Leptospiraceae bacterium]MCK6381349.1 hypothetical protein [Leptospiraceae bacterium]
MNKKVVKKNTEVERLTEPSNLPFQKWKRWGPYVSERSWGTVREDYSYNGNAWDYFPHDHARSRAYRWGEDGIAGFCDRYQLLVFSHSFWNGKDPILKERLFGLSHDEGNHGEDVKEIYYYLDGLPTYSYCKYLYKYPQNEYPYNELIQENKKRGLADDEYEIIDSGVFDNNEYFDIFIEYAKPDYEDICVRIEVCNRSEHEAEIHVIPQIFFRNQWSWTKQTERPFLKLDPSNNRILIDDNEAISMPNLSFDYKLGRWYLYSQEGGEFLFTDNDTNTERLYGISSLSKYTKDAFHRKIVNGEDSTNPKLTGTKACVHFKNVVISGKESKVFYLRLTNSDLIKPFHNIEEVFIHKRKEADDYYNSIHPKKSTNDEKRIQRQALAGMLLSKQIYLFDVKKWLDGDDPNFPPPSQRRRIRNFKWPHLNSMRILTIPDKWEYPWFAAWDLAFQTIPLALVDIGSAKDQLWLLLFEQFQHPNGQIPAYEWEYSDLNPPVHAYAVLRVYNMEKEKTGKGDRLFLEKCFHKLLINFAWWVNRVDSGDNNIFEGGFLGLDNITVVDRSSVMPGGAVLEQSDATGWMGMFCLNLMKIALELARENRSYEWLATKFFQHFAYISSAMKHMGGREHEHQLWDEADGFFYDVLRYPNGRYEKFRVRSLVGLIPMFATEILTSEELDRFPNFKTNFFWFLENRKEISEECVTEIHSSEKREFLLTTVNQRQLSRLLHKVGHKNEFKSDFGLRSLSKFHELNPFIHGGEKIGYEPGVSHIMLKGGNSNWRGPVWFPTSFMMIESLKKLSHFYEDKLKIPIHGEEKTLYEIAKDLSDSLINIFKTNPEGKRAVFGNSKKFQEDVHFKDYILFYEYFHAETGQGLGASHQTGWTGLIASIIDEWRK